MAFPVYVLLPKDVEWTAVPGSTAQAPAPVRWYLRQHMPEAVTQTAVLIAEDERVLEHRIAAVAHRAIELGGMAIDAQTQERIDPSALAVPH